MTPVATGGATAVSSLASSARRRRRAAGGRLAGWGGGRRRRGLLEPRDLLLRQRACEVRHRPAGAEEPRLRRLRGDEEELALAEAADRLVELRDVRAAARRAEPLEHPGLVVLGLEAPDEPRARVRHRLVVQVDGVLGREHEAEPERAALLEDRQDRLLRRRRGARGHVAEHLVHVRERAQVGRALLAPHPRHELREDERDDELALGVREVRQVDDGAAWPALGGEEERLGVERLALAPGGERRRGDERVEGERELRPLGGREELVDLEDAQLAERRRLDLADQRAEVEVAARAPRVLDEVREQDVLAARERVRGDPDEREQARHGALDLVAERLGVRLPREVGRAQRADHVERDAGRRAGGVDGHVGGVAERLQPLGADAAPLEALAPDRRLARGVLVDRDARGRRLGLADPRAEARRLQVGEDERQVAHVALRVEDERGDPGEQRLLDQADGEARLARPGHPDHDAVRRQVARAEDDPVASGLTRLRIEGEPEMEGAPVGHSRVSLWSGRCSTASSFDRARRPGWQRVTRPTGSGWRRRRERRGSTSSRGASTRSSTGSSRRTAEACCSSCRGSTPRARTASSGGSFRHVNPAGLTVTSFGVPAGVELEHDYLWRIHQALPPRGPDRRLQPLALRGHRRRADAEPGAGGRLAPSLRAPARVRAGARRRGNDGPQGLPQRLAGGAAAPAPGADRRPREAVEVPARATSRCTRASTTGSPRGTRP